VKAIAPVLAMVFGASLPLSADGQWVLPPPAIKVDGIDPVPVEVAKKIAPYADFKITTVLGWRARQRELLVLQRLTDTDQVQRVMEPGLAAAPLTRFDDLVSKAEWQPGQAAFLLYSRGTGGDEVDRLYRLDPASGESAAVSPEGVRVAAWAWSPKGDRVAYTTVPVGRGGVAGEVTTTLHVADPMAPAKAVAVASLKGGTWDAPSFSADGRRLAIVEHRSSSATSIWIVDLATGKGRRVTPERKGEPVFYDAPQFSPDGKGLFAISDRGSDFKRVAYLDIATGRESALATNLKFDVEGLAVSAKAGRIAFVTNEAGGSHVLRFLDLATRKELPRPALVPGVISALQWREDGVEIAFTHASARSPGDAFSYDVKAHRVTRWTNGNSPAVNTSVFPEPRLVRWKSFDGREITGHYYHPPSRFEGVRPAIVVVHGGPAAQAYAGYIARYNYFLNELGIAIVLPNVRGSTGFGKAFQRLDDQRLREDSVKDLGALLDWIAAQPGLDANRVMVMGGSYGGYMTLAAAVQFADRLAGTVSTVGISNFVTFLENTEAYRRDHRRQEYGDERDPAMREFLQSISPLTHVDRMAKPMLVIQGKRDPRVPWTESEQMVAALKGKGRAVGYILADDEGHGFKKKANADFAFLATVEFVRRHLLGPAP
jgi:dipeptidyl aminopeptidase/acylaminoacyl peptidase